MQHVKHFEELGEAYHQLNVLQKETYVWQKILAERGSWTKEELQGSLDYINSIRVEKYGLPPLKIK